MVADFVSQVGGDHHPDSHDGDGWKDEGQTGCSPHPDFLKYIGVIITLYCVFCCMRKWKDEKDFLNDFYIDIL